MNIEIAKKRINNVLSPDTMTTSRSDFLATHVAVNNIELYSKFDPADSSRSIKFQEAKSEEDVLSQFLLQKEKKHQLLLVVGESGAGKSHLIRWFNERLLNEQLDDKVILFVRRSDNTLKGTIKQLLEKPEISSISNKEVYKRLVAATAVIDENKLKSEILSKFILEVEHDKNQYEVENNDVTLKTHEKKRLVPFLKYKQVQSKLLEIGGPIDRIYTKIAQSDKVVNDIDAFFLADDFEYSEDEIDDICENADKDTICVSRRLSVNPGMKDSIAKYLNQFIDVVIQRCSGLESGDFEEIFKDIRRTLKKNEKSLLILIEDITSFTGVNIALLNALTTEHTGYGNEDLCPISSVIGITSGYFKDTFKTNYRDRVSLYINLPNDVFNDEYLIEFIAKYLNTMSLESNVLDQWVTDGASPEKYPVHNVTEVDGKNWDYYKTNYGKELCLYPFTRYAVQNLYKYRLSTKQLRTPRYILQYIVEPVVKDVIYRKDTFPNIELKQYNGNDSSSLRTRIFNLPNVDDEIKERLYLFSCIWGNAKDNVLALNDGSRLIAGIHESIYREFGLPILTNLAPVKSEDVHLSGAESKNNKYVEIDRPKDEINTALKKKINNAIDILNKWVSGSKINVGATTDNVVLLSNARDEITKYVLSAINWQSEGVSQNILEKINNSKFKNFIGFQNQSSALDRTLFIMEASRSNQSVIEAFIRWSELGKKTWDFENGEYFALVVETWLERHKAEIVKAIKSVNDENCFYQEYAFGSELLRQIFFGQIDNKWKNYSSSTFLSNELLDKKSNSEHSVEWNRLLDTILSTDKHKDNWKVVWQFYNIVQGARGGSKIYLNRPEFDEMFSKIKDSLLTLDYDEDRRKDNVPTRDEFRVQFGKIVSKVDNVYRNELEKIKNAHEELIALLGVSTMKSTELVELVENIKNYYDEVNKAQLYIPYDSELIGKVKKYRASISRSLEEIDQIVNEKNIIDSLILMSHDPLKVIDAFRSLVKKVVKDMEDVNAQINRNSTGDNNNRCLENTTPYETERKIINDCINIFEKV
jgi:energy-coupling factor transporter ATP-binding protein EcfA2